MSKKTKESEMKEKFINPICPICGEVKFEDRHKYDCEYHVILFNSRLCGCSICYSPIVLGRMDICSNPACSGWHTRNNNAILYKDKLVFAEYMNTGNIYYVFDTPRTIGIVKLFYQELYYKIIKELNIPKKDYMYVF